MRLLACLLFPLSALAFATSQPAPEVDDDAATVIAGCRIEPDSQCPNADLRGADLRNQDLTRMNLSGANLAGADLRHAKLDLANLQQAQLNGADLTRASLQQANLRGADLSGAKLVAIQAWGLFAQGAQWQGADLPRRLPGIRPPERRQAAPGQFACGRPGNDLAVPRRPQGRRPARRQPAGSEAGRSESGRCRPAWQPPALRQLPGQQHGGLQGVPGGLGLSARRIAGIGSIGLPVLPGIGYSNAGAPALP